MLQLIQKGLNENTTDTLRRDILRFEPKDKTDSRSAVYKPVLWYPPVQLLVFVDTAMFICLIIGTLSYHTQL